MSLVKCPVVALGSDGKPVAAAKIEIKLRATGARPEEGPYTTEKGTTTAPNPAPTEEHGKANVWVPPGAYEAVVTGTGITTYVEPFDIVSGAESGIEHTELEAVDRTRLNLSGVSLFTTLTLLLPGKTKLPAAGVMPAQWRFEESDEGRTKGTVRLRGSFVVNAGQTLASSEAFAQLPTVPARRVAYQIQVGAGGARMTIDEEGKMYVNASAGDEIWLDGVTFPIGGEAT